MLCWSPPEIGEVAARPPLSGLTRLHAVRRREELVKSKAPDEICFMLFSFIFLAVVSFSSLWPIQVADRSTPLDGSRQNSLRPKNLHQMFQEP